MATKAEQYLDNLTAKGKISFTMKQLCRDLGISHGAGLVTVKRLKQENKAVSPSRGYYLVLTPEFRSMGCLPADFFIDDLMQHLNMTYYVSLLSASMFYGAAHQQPQMLQVMLQNKRENINCGKSHIEFIQNSHLAETPIKKIKTRTGYMNVSTPEATAMDMMKYMSQCGGIHRIATVIEELAEVMDGRVLSELAEAFKGSSWMGRLGYLLDKFKYDGLAASLYENFDKKSRITSLVPYAPTTGVPRNKKWRVAINAITESDLDDTY